MAVTQTGTPGFARATSGSVQVTWGSGQTHAAGALLVYVVHAYALTSTTAISTPSGTTKLGESVGGTNKNRSAIYTRTADNTSADTVTFTSTLTGSYPEMTVHVYQLSGHDTGTPVAASNFATNGTTTLTALPASALTVARDGSFAISGWSHYKGTSAQTMTWTPGSGFTEALGDKGNSYQAHGLCDYDSTVSAGTCQESAPSSNRSVVTWAASIAVIQPPPPATVVQPACPGGSGAAGQPLIPYAAFAAAFTDDVHPRSSATSRNVAVRNAIADEITSGTVQEVWVGGDCQDTADADYTAATYGYDAVFGSSLNAYSWVSPGNHDVDVSAGGFLAYFGTRTPSGRLMQAASTRWCAHSVVIGGTEWRIYNLSSGLDGGYADSLASGSAQYNWLSADMTAHDACPMVVIMHGGAWGSYNSSGYLTTDLLGYTQDVITLCHTHLVDLIMVGHEHQYVRWPKADSSAVAASDGFRQVTGPTSSEYGNAYTEAVPPMPSSGLVPEAHVADTGNYNAQIGYVKVTLHAWSYDLRYYVTPDTGGIVRNLTDSLLGVASNKAPPATTVQPSCPEGSGAAAQPQIATGGGGTTVTVSCPAGSGAAGQPGITPAAAAPPGLAAGSGAAGQPATAGKIQVPAAPGGSGAAYQPATAGKITAGAAAGSGAASQPATAGVASAAAGGPAGSGAASQPTVSTSGSTSVSVTAPGGSGAAGAPSTFRAEQVTVAAAAGSGAAPAPVTAALPTPAAAAGSGAASAPSVVTSGSTTVSVSAPAGSGTASAATAAPAAAVSIAAPAGSGAPSAPGTGDGFAAGQAAGSGSAAAPAAAALPAPACAGGSGAAGRPTVSISGQTVVEPACAGGSGAAAGPGTFTTVGVAAGLAAGSGQAPAASGAQAQHASPVCAGGSGAAAGPALLLVAVIPAPCAAGSGASARPVPGGWFTVAAPGGSGAAAGPATGPAARVGAGLAEGSGTGYGAGVAIVIPALFGVARAGGGLVTPARGGGGLVTPARGGGGTEVQATAGGRP